MRNRKRYALRITNYALTNVSEVQENTEAKLAAYIDGELEGPERAEIEKLLEQHPNYRRVLDQLRVARDLLRGLPREPAPPELSEAFNGQLERTVLLEGLGSSGRPKLTLSRWPQMAAIAAILILTVGLGVVVWFVLPRGKPPIQTVDTRPVPGSARLQTQPAETVEEARDRDEAAAGPAVRGGGVGGAGGLAVTNTLNTPAPELLADNVYQNPQVQELLNNNALNNLRRFNAANQDNPSPDALVVLVRSNDPQQVHQDLAAYCTANSISWEAVPPRVQSALNFSLQNFSENEALLQQQQNGAMGKRLESDKESNEKQQSQARDQFDVRMRGMRELNKDATPIESVYVARNLSRRQAQELNDALERQSLARSDSTTRPANDSLPAMANAPVQAGQLAPQQQQVAQTNRVQRQQFAYWRSRNQAVAQQGQGYRATADVERSALVQANADSKAQTQPTSQPSDEAGSTRAARTLAQSTVTYAASAPAAPQAQQKLAAAEPQGITTAPSAAATAPTTQIAGDEPVDVLIVVQRADENPTTQPATTQPSAGQ